MAESNDRTEQCAICEDAIATIGFETQAFNYGPVADGIVLSARVPVWTCAGCGERYLDADAEDIKHEAVCAYLGRLTPSEIRGMRVSFGMLQDDFATFSGYGSASIKRWEAGSQIQSESVDKHLRLLRSLGVAEVTKRTARPAEPEFRTAISASVRDQARRFNLRSPSYQPELMAA
jgi:putative zinc finger/helix-turn-helix YgiT family protein